MLTSNNSCDLVRIGVVPLGGKGGGGRPDMAQGGGPDGSKLSEAVRAVKAAIKAPA
ncbi:MAG: DHHA1 domain-containing protein, partial [Parvibaculum sp.]